MTLPEIPISRLVAFVEEDAPFGDITSDSVLVKQECSADIIVKENVLLAGLSEIQRLFRHYGVKPESEYTDGDQVDAGATVLSLSGDAHAILLIERTALNLIGRMSGIATETRRIQDMVTAVNPSCRVTATRKTAPGLRIFDKKACMIGGADPHRFSLSDAILIKDTHRVLIPLDEAIQRAKKSGAYHRIEAEAESAEEAVIAAMAGADILLLDNMNPDQVQNTLQILTEKGLREKLIIELSGGINPGIIREYATLNVERISLGMLTHSVRNADFSLEMRQKR